MIEMIRTGYKRLLMRSGKPFNAGTAIPHGLGEMAYQFS